MQLFRSCLQTFHIMSSSLDHEALLDGSCDIVVVKHKTGQYFSTGFFVCFGPYSVLHHSQLVSIKINGKAINSVRFSVDRHGYVHPYHPNQQQMKSMDLNWGKNQIQFTLANHTIRAQVFLLSDNDKIVVSDVDGTLTTNDIGGLASNLINKSYLHEGYSNLMQGIVKNGYHVVWLTMRSLPLYEFSKNYIIQHTGIEGALITQPQEFVPAVKKQLFKQTKNIKANLMRNIKQLFPKSAKPFAAGFGNRQNDSIAYLNAEIELQHIYQIDKNSVIQKMNVTTNSLSYRKMLENIDEYFPPYNAPKIGY